MGGVHRERGIMMWWEVWTVSVIRTVLTDFYIVFAVLCWIDLNKDCIENSVAIMSDNSNSDLELADDKNWFIFIANFRSYWIKFLCESDFSTSQDNNRVRGKVIMLWSCKLHLEGVEEVGDVGGPRTDFVVDPQTRGGDHQGGHRDEEQGHWHWRYQHCDRCSAVDKQRCNKLTQNLEKHLLQNWTLFRSHFLSIFQQSICSFKSNRDFYGEFLDT